MSDIIIDTAQSKDYSEAARVIACAMITNPLAVAVFNNEQEIGKKLVKHYCDFLDSTCSAGYIETDRDVNVPFYESFGFKVIDEGPILNVPNWYLWRGKKQF